MSSREFRTRPIIITDFETTGLDPHVHDIIDIGAIAVDHDLHELGRFDMKVIPRRICTAEAKALEINGYTPEKWTNARSYFEAASQFQSFSADGILAAWNITFEYEFLKELFLSTRTHDLMDYHRIDLPSIAWMLLPDLKQIGLDKVGAYFGLEPEQKPHSGIRGAEYELEVLRYLKGQTLFL